METNTQRNGSRVLTLVAPSVPGPERVAPITESTARLLGTAAILGLGLIHILDAASTYNSTRWIFWAYMALIVAVVPVALFCCTRPRHLAGLQPPASPPDRWSHICGAEASASPATRRMSATGCAR
ncbi:MAG: hypothetical protein JO342_13345 [Solirubrobacterales bacterium]|nr:hypothetical protein [Solirubrobacterales bacterium]